MPVDKSVGLVSTEFSDLGRLSPPRTATFPRLGDGAAPKREKSGLTHAYFHFSVVLTVYVM